MMESNLTTTSGLAKVSDSENAVDRLEGLLNGQGIQMASKSVFEHECLLVARQRELARGIPDNRPKTEQLKDLRAYHAFMHVVGKLIRQFDTGNIEPFLPHLRLLAKGQAGQGERLPSTNQRDTEDSNKLFELFVGLCCAKQFNNIRLEKPSNAKGNNPDVMADFEGTTWGFACKVITSQSGLTMWDRLADGVEQIEKSGAQRGAVLFNLSALLDHSKFSPLTSGPVQKFMGYARFADLDADLLKASGDTLEPLIARYSVDDVDRLFEGRKCERGVIGYFETAAFVLRPEGPMPGEIIVRPAGLITTGCANSLHRYYGRTELPERIPALEALQSAIVGR